MNTSFLDRLYTVHQNCPACPTRDQVEAFFESLLGVLFPDLYAKTFDTKEELTFHMLNLKTALYEMLYMYPNRESIHATNKAEAFFTKLESIYDRLLIDIRAMYEGDPAAESQDEIIRSYPGFYAIAAYRIAHELYQLGVKIIPRMITEIAHTATGVDIHPGASIGKGFCIDHGTGVVIGETTIIGDFVKVYQGVTLGALSVDKKLASTKRHPTIEDYVVLYAGATVLGGDTVIGHHSIVGGNTWITQSLAPHSKEYYLKPTNEEQ